MSAECRRRRSSEKTAAAAYDCNINNDAAADLCLPSIPGERGGGEGKKKKDNEINNKRASPSDKLLFILL